MGDLELGDTTLARLDVICAPLMSELATYKANLDVFIAGMQSAFVKKVTFEEDGDPTFNKATLPISFRYCLSVTFYTDKGSFMMYTSAISRGFETFWTKKIDIEEDGGVSKVINARVMDIKKWDGLGDFPYKLRMQFENSTLTIFAAEIYDKLDGGYEISMNDEMILVFEDENEAKKFEAINNDSASSKL